MKIQRLEINNWRSVVHETVEFHELMIFIGQNNHGKSNILSAILFFFGELSPDDLDYCNHATEMWVEIVFGDLNDEEKSTFRKYVTAENTIKIRRSASKALGVQLNGYCQIPMDDWLLESNASAYSTRDAAKDLPLYDLLPKSGRITQEQFKQAQSDFLRNNAATLAFEYRLEESHFLGAKNVAKGIFGDLIFIPSIKKASDELSSKGSSSFSQLYSRVIARISETNEDFLAAKSKLADLTKLLCKTSEDGTQNDERPSELSSLESMLEDELKIWNARIEIDIAPPNIDEIFRVGANVWIDDGIKTDIERKGHGMQRALVFALLRSWSKTLRAEREKQTSENDTDEKVRAGRTASRSTYFIFEEPELFLHPQAQRELFSSLVNLSTEDNQIILCTHSSSFVGINHYKSICLVKKVAVDSGTCIVQCSDELFEEDEAKRKFNLAYWMNPDRGELFFARKVILVEGPTDKTVIPMLAKRLGVNRHDCSIIDCGGKDNIPLYLRLLNRFKVDYVTVFDRDHQSSKSADAIASADAASAKILDVIDATIGKSVIFENDIEEEIGLIDSSAKNKAWLAVQHIEEPYAIPDRLEQRIREIYS